jgi:hypothetical protein
VICGLECLKSSFSWTHPRLQYILGAIIKRIKEGNFQCYVIFFAENNQAMPSLLDRLPDIARLCCLAGLVILNSLAYYASTERPLDSNLLLFNISAGLYLAFIYRWATNTRQVVVN